jgi:hypothetical protein
MLRGIAVAVVLMWSMAGWSTDAKGYVPDPGCSRYMKIHLTRFPKQGSDQELVLESWRYVGPGAITDWLDETAELCTTAGACVKAQSARVQVLHHSAHYILMKLHLRDPRLSGNFEVKLADGTEIRGSFTARWIRRRGRIICE